MCARCAPHPENKREKNEREEGKKGERKEGSKGASRKGACLLLRNLI